jgi:hypothetical protein
MRHMGYKPQKRACQSQGAAGQASCGRAAAGLALSAAFPINPNIALEGRLEGAIRISPKPLDILNQTVLISFRSQIFLWLSISFNTRPLVWGFFAACGFAGRR